VSARKNDMTSKSINNDIEQNSLFIRLVMIKEMSVIVPIIILIIVGICVNPNFLNKNNLWSLMRTASFMGIVAIPVGFLLTTKSLDLSVGQVVASSGIIFAILTIKLGVPLPLAVVLILIYASLVGLINGVLIVDVGLPAFLTTLGMQFVLSGITSYITKGEGFRGFPQWFTAIGQARFLGFVTAEMWVILFLAVVGHIILTKTVLGQQILLIGTNALTADLCGMNVKNIRKGAHIITSLCGAVAAILFCSRTAQATSGTGAEWDLQLMVAALLGGTSMYGGTTSVIGTVLGMIYMRLLINVLLMLGLHADWQFVGMGVSMVLAILFNVYRTRLLDR